MGYKYVYDADFNESEFETLVNMLFLGLFKWNFKIPTRQEEVKKGYDFKIEGSIPIYLQYKVSKYYSSKTKSNLLEERRSVVLGKYDSRGFFGFKLHAYSGEKNLEKYVQHNLLYKLNRKGIACYVAPVFYQRRELYSFMLKILDILRTPELHFNYHLFNYFSLEVRMFSNNITIFEFPFFPVSLAKSLIFIKPHREVNDDGTHHYTYNFKKYVVFHSEPEHVKENSFYLDEFLEDITEKSHKERYLISNKENFSREIWRLIRDELDEESKNNKEREDIVDLKDRFLDIYFQEQDYDKFKKLRSGEEFEEFLEQLIDIDKEEDTILSILWISFILEQKFGIRLLFFNPWEED